MNSYLETINSIPGVDNLRNSALLRVLFVLMLGLLACSLFGPKLISPALAAQATGETAILSNYALGVKAYQEGEFRRAFDAWSLGAYEGNAEAQYNLGVLYLEGRGVERNVEQARDWFIRAAEKSHVEAQYNLGHMSLSGMGAEKNVEAALLWWKLAAEGGYAQAQFNYGRALYLGVEDYADKDGGLELISLAAQQNDRRAMEFLSKNADEIALLKAANVESTATVVEPAVTGKELAAEKIVPIVSDKVARSDEPIVEEPPVSKALPVSEPGKIKLRIVRDRHPVQKDYLMRSADIPVTIYTEADLRVPMGKLAPRALLKVTAIKENKIRVLPAAGLPVVWVERDRLILDSLYPSIKEENTEIFVQPGATKIGILPAGVRIEVLEQKRNWVKLSVSSPGLGWISASKLAYSGESSQQLKEAWLAEFQAAEDPQKKASKPDELIVANVQENTSSGQPESLAPGPEGEVKEISVMKSIQISDASDATQDQSNILINDNEWLFTQQKGAHVIHLFTLLDIDKALRISNQAPYRDQAHLFTTRVNQNQWAFLLLGPYIDEAAATAARRALPAQYVKHAQVRQLALIAENRCAKQQSLDALQSKGLDAYCF